MQNQSTAPGAVPPRSESQLQGLEGLTSHLCTSVSSTSNKNVGEAIVVRPTQPCSCCANLELKHIEYLQQPKPCSMQVLITLGCGWATEEETLDADKLSLRGNRSPISEGATCSLFLHNSSSPEGLTQGLLHLSVPPAIR